MDSNAPPSPRDRHRPNFRAQHRARSHESAHADGVVSADDSGVRPDLPLICRGEAQVVTTDDHLRQLLAELRADGSFAYDTEFIGELTYYPQLCVVQVASHQRIGLIDPLAGIDLRPLWELLADPSVEKIVHAGEQDIEPVVRHLNRPAANVFDTQIAAGLIGLPYPVSLSKLVVELTGAKLGKGLTFSHWDQRPLSSIQLRYAADDVRYLPAARAEMGRRLDKLGHAAWAGEECTAMCDTSLYRFDPETSYLRVRGAASLPPRNQAVLRELTNWRDAAARKHDVPPRSFLKDEVLADLAKNPVKSVDKLARVRGLPRPVEHEYGNEIVEATSRAMSMPAPNLPSAREPEPTATEKFRSDALFAAAQCICAGLSLDPSLVASRQDVGEFYRHIIGDGAGEPPLLLRGWRREAVGEMLTEFLAGKRKVGLEWADEALRATVGGRP
jgi:ribonuclease D